eukprot:2001343-Amphidinium_carterae.1
MYFDEAGELSPLKDVMAQAKKLIPQGVGVTLNREVSYHVRSLCACNGNGAQRPVPMRLGHHGLSLVEKIVAATCSNRESPCPTEVAAKLTVYLPACYKAINVLPRSV